MTDHAQVIRDTLSWIHTHPDLSMEFQRDAEKHLDALVAERDRALAPGGDRILGSKLLAQLEAAEAERDCVGEWLQESESRVTELEARLAEADEIIDDCWHQFAIDIRGKLTPGGLSTLEMVDDYRNSRDALAKEGTP